MKRTNFWTPLLLALPLGGCAVETASNTGEGPPPLSVEQQAVVEGMKKGTLAEIPVGEGTVSFIELSPGDVIITKRFPVGAEVPNVEGANELSLEELYAAYAPNEPIPEALSAAMERSHHQADVLSEESDVDLQSEPEESFAGLSASDPSLDGVREKSQNLTSSISQQWFVDTFCDFGGTDGSFCFTTAWQGAYGSKKSHQHNAVICGDTGAARATSYVSGSPRVIVDVPYGQCWTVGAYHGSHGAFGSKSQRVLRTTIDWAQASVRMAGFWMDDDGRNFYF